MGQHKSKHYFDAQVGGDNHAAGQMMQPPHIRNLHESKEERRKRRKWRKKQGYSLPAGVDHVGGRLSAASSHTDLPDIEQDDAILMSYSRSNVEKFSHLRPFYQRRASSEEPAQSVEIEVHESPAPRKHVQVIRVNDESGQHRSDLDHRRHDPSPSSVSSAADHDEITYRRSPSDEYDEPQNVLQLTIPASNPSAKNRESSISSDEGSDDAIVEPETLVSDDPDQDEDVIEESFKMSPQLDQEDIDLLNALMAPNRDNFVPEPSIVLESETKDYNEEQIAPPSPYATAACISETHVVVQPPSAQDNYEKPIECGRSDEDVDEATSAHKAVNDSLINHEKSPAESSNHIRIPLGQHLPKEISAILDAKSAPTNLFNAAAPDLAPPDDDDVVVVVVESKQKIKDPDESAIFIDDDDDDQFIEYTNLVRPSIDCDVLNSIIEEENDEDLRSIVQQDEEDIAQKPDIELLPNMELEHVESAPPPPPPPPPPTAAPMLEEESLLGSVGEKDYSSEEEEEDAINGSSIIDKAEAAIIIETEFAELLQKIAAVPEREADPCHEPLSNSAEKVPLMSHDDDDDDDDDDGLEENNANLDDDAVIEVACQEEGVGKVQDEISDEQSGGPISHHDCDEESRNRIDFSVTSRLLDDTTTSTSMDNVGKETDVDDDEEEAADDDLYHSKLVTTCVDSDEENDDDSYDLKVPNESWEYHPDLVFKSSHDRPQPVGCSSDSPSVGSTSSGGDKDNYDSLEEDQPAAATAVYKHVKQKRSLPPIPQDHNQQQQRAYEILRQQWPRNDDSLEDLSAAAGSGGAASFRMVEGRSNEDYFNQHAIDRHHSLNLPPKRQLPKPPPVSPIVLPIPSPPTNADDSGCVSFENELVVAAADCAEPKKTHDAEVVANFWVGFTEPSTTTTSGKSSHAVKRRPKNHDRLTSVSSADKSRKRHSAPPGSFDSFNFQPSGKVSSLESKRKSAPKALKSRSNYHAPPSYYNIHNGQLGKIFFIIVLITGRIHSAVVSGINIDTRSVTVEWFERGETKGKEVELETLLSLNQDLAPANDNGNNGTTTAPNNKLSKVNERKSDF
jgi:hypothetical protein